ncbi:hypothetical protein F0562_022556 [Nyssa sinensis]|uniref:Uncharacterized protein n=1 Tax=Nyssa sinensis TaxID=561372 RepID=A0A5J5BNF9_9ASTE|nr:hypothetical protein F0562_022556 [Nyssa sinensis]
MGAEANPAEQAPAETSSENVEALLEAFTCLTQTFISLKVSSAANFRAARYDDIDDVISLASAGVSLDSKDSQGRTALHMASANGHLDIVDYLISSGVDVNTSNVEKNTPLHWACLNGHVEVVKKLILAGASVSVLNSHERTPMDEAVGRGKMDVIDAINAGVAQIEISAVTVS